jgi:DNA-directed RNA polymerase subunit RPC12/RpoP
VSAAKRRETRREAFEQVRDWMRSCTRRQLRDRLDHQIRDLADPEHRCSDCGKQFETKAGWAGHRQKHIAEDQDPVACETCGEEFANEWAVIGHQQKHIHDGDAIACGICGEEYRNKEDFNIHKQHHLGARNDPVRCEDCGTECRNQRMLKVHEGQVHAGTDGDDEPDAVRARILQELQRKEYRPIAKIAADHGVPPEYVAYLDESKRDAGGRKCLLCGELFDTKKGVGMHLRRTHDKAGKSRVADRFSVEVDGVGKTVAAVQRVGDRNTGGVRGR